ncbi:DUF6000 family protein [Streptomyces melanogenes]|uniref:DUF6000 family protein n=1 Tax=Streptomyces melanogenes TaxID=67326 RepID=UPI0037B4C2C7
MHHSDHVGGLRELVARFVTPERRYLKLGGGLLGKSGPERALFARKLGEAAGEITPEELAVLLDEGGWRERKTAAWLIAVAGRSEFRERLGELLLASEGPYAGQAYCVALTTFATPGDASLLVTYLDRYLPRADLTYDQPRALGALLHLDNRLGTGYAARFLTPGGLWQQWTKLPPETANQEAEGLRAFIGQLHCAVQESAQHCATAPLSR